MANEKENIENDVNDDSINIDDIEGLERDLPLEKNDDLSVNKESNDEENDESEALEILPDGKLKTSKKNEPKIDVETSESKPTLKDRLIDKKNIRILLIVLAVLILVTVAFIFFNTQPKVVTEKPTETVSKVKELPPIETYEFKLDHINVSRLNKKLELLTKYELLGMTEEEYLKEEKLKALKKAKEEEELKLRLEQEAKEKEALEKAQAEEMLRQEKLKEEQALKEAQEKEKEATLSATQGQTESSITMDEANAQMNLQEGISNENLGNTFLKFVQINTNKKSIYKTYLKDLKKIDSRLNACRNIKNYIEVFVGPLNVEEDVSTLINAIKSSNLSDNVIFIEITKEEFANRCMVYEN